jgi:hypothetical protein
MPVRSNHSAPISEIQPVTLTGPTGPQTGVTGPIGMMGLSVTGPAGPIGVSGPVGPPGATGLGGFTGPTGAFGATGPQGGSEGTGPTGDYGEWGPDGPEGNTGPLGRTGSAGRPGGPTGVSGATGPTGAGNIGGVEVPFFVDSETFLTASMLSCGPNDSPWGYASVSTGTIALLPVFVPFARHYTEMVCESQQALYPTIAMRLGIYDCGNDMHPTVPLFDSGQILPIGQGRMGAFFDLDLVAKPYWLAISITQSSNFRAFSNAKLFPVLGYQRYTVVFDPKQNWRFEAGPIYFNGSGWNFNTALPDLTAKTLSSGGASIILGIR